MAEQTKLRVLIETPGIGQLSKLRGSLTQVDVAAKGLGNNFAKARIELKRVEQTTKSSVNSTRALRDSFRELANSVEFGSKKFRIATREAERLDKQLAKMERRGPSAKQRLGGIAKGVGAVAGAGVFGGFEGAAGALIGLGVGGLPGAIAGGAIGAQVGQVNKALAEVGKMRAQFNLLQVALAGVSDDLEDYQAGMTAVREISQQFLIPQTEVIGKFVQLKASVRGAGFDTETTSKVFKGLAAAVLSTGGSIEDTSAALRAAAQVFSKGKVSAEELRQQIGERLPGAFTQFAASMGISSQELDKALENGEVRLDSFVVFTEDLLKLYAKNSEAIAEAPESAGRRLQVALVDMQLSYGNFFTKIGSSFQEFLSDIIEAANQNEKQVKMVLVNIVLGLEDFKDALRIFVKEAYQILGPFILWTIENGMKVAEIIAQIMPGGGAAGPEAQNQYGLDYAERQKQRFEELFGETPPIVFGGKTNIIEPETDVTDGGTTTQGRADISDRLLAAQLAALRETNEKRKVALELEAKLIQIEESKLQKNEKILRINEASVRAKQQLEEIEKRRVRDLKALLNSFKVKGGGFDFSGIDQGEGPKTPFEALRVGADEFTDSLKGALGAAQELATVGLQGISDGITNLVVNGTLNFREFAASLLRDMARIIMQQVVMKSLMQAIGFGTNTVEKTDYTKFFTSQPGDFPIPKFAKGGITRGVSIAGEAGPEAVVPLPDGRTIPVRMQGEGTKVVVNVDAQGTAVQGDTANANRLGEAIGTAVRQELLKQKRPGGLLA